MRYLKRRLGAAPKVFNAYPVGDIATGLSAKTLDKDSVLTMGVLDGFVPHANAPSSEDSVRLIEEFSQTIPNNFEAFGGSLSPGDLLFLDQMIARTEARHVLEIGTAFGYSAAFMLKSLHERSGDGRVTSIDLIAGTKPWAPENQAWAARKTGSLVGEFFPEYSDKFRFHGGRTTLDLPEDINGTVDLAIVDAAHFHPWPMIDVLVLCDVLKPGQWIIMQDIELTLRGVLHKAAWGFEEPIPNQSYGAQIAFEYWPGTKIKGLNGCFNMGAIQVPEDASASKIFVDNLLKYPFEYDVNNDPKVRSFLDNYANK